MPNWIIRLRKEFHWGYNFLGTRITDSLCLRIGDWGGTSSPWLHLQYQTSYLAKEGLRKICVRQHAEFKFKVTKTHKSEADGALALGLTTAWKVSLLCVQSGIYDFDYWSITTGQPWWLLRVPKLKANNGQKRFNIDQWKTVICVRFETVSEHLAIKSSHHPVGLMHFPWKAANKTTFSKLGEKGSPRRCYSLLTNEEQTALLHLFLAFTGWSLEHPKLKLKKKWPTVA